MPPKTPTVQAVNAVLKSAGFDRAEQKDGSSTEGFHVHSYRGTVLVNYWSAPLADADFRKVRTMLENAVEVIGEAGYQVTTETDVLGRPDYLTVTARTGEPDAR